MIETEYNLDHLEQMYRKMGENLLKRRRDFKTNKLASGLYVDIIRSELEPSIKNELATLAGASRKFFKQTADQQKRYFVYRFEFANSQESESRKKAILLDMKKELLNCRDCHIEGVEVQELWKCYNEGKTYKIENDIVF